MTVGFCIFWFILIHLPGGTWFEFVQCLSLRYSSVRDTWTSGTGAVSLDFKSPITTKQERMTESKLLRRLGGTNEGKHLVDQEIVIPKGNGGVGRGWNYAGC